MNINNHHEALADGIRAAVSIAAVSLLAITPVGCASSVPSIGTDVADDIVAGDSSSEAHDSPDDPDEPYFDFDEADTDGATVDDC